MFIIFFSIFIGIFTIFENLSIGIIVLLLILTIIGILNLMRKKNMPQLAGYCLLAFSLAGGSVILYNRKFNLQQHSMVPVSVQHATGVFIGSGQILDTSSQGKYIFSDGIQQYSLSSSKNYAIGDRIWLAGYLKTTHSEQLAVNNKNSFQADILSGLFHYSFNYDKWLKMKGLAGNINEGNAITLSGNGNLGFILSLRKNLQYLVKSSYGEDKVGGLILGLLIGDKSQIPKAEYQTFIDSGLVHIVAVSGGNIVMLIIFLGYLLLWIPFYRRNAIMIIVIIFYGLVCGMDSSVFRAVVMGGMGMIALFRGREINIWRSLAIAYILMLLIDPYVLVYDVGFIFSFSAIIGLIYFGKIGKIAEKSKKGLGGGNLLKSGLNYLLKNYISPSIGASIGIFPVMIFFMGKISLLGIIGNLLVLPIIPFVMIYGFISMIFYQIFPGIGFLIIEKYLVIYIYKISDLLSQYGIYMMIEGDWIKYFILFLAIIRFIHRRFRSPDVPDDR